jgi:RHS repeat-associated protein
LELNPRGDVVLQSQQPMIFTAIPVDREGTPVHGLQAEWESSDKQVIFVKKTGQAIAGKPGQATLKATAGRLTGTIRITVIEGTNERFGGKKKQNSTRSGRVRAQNSTPRNTPNVPTRNVVGAGKRHHSSGVETNAGSVAGTRTAGMSPLLPLRDPTDDPLPDSETNSLYQASNAVGSPPGKKKAAAMTPSAAIESTETNSTKNFTFGLPVAGLAGRGLNVSLSLVYNSQVWNKSTDGSTTYMTYDVDSGWPATGWRISLGQIEDQGSYGFTLTEPNGTRRALVYTSAYNYDTTDGSFIHYYGGSGWGTLYYPDGTQVYYGAAGGGYRSYPTEIIDRNGNYILISYAGTSGAGPKISSIEDTLGRYIHFYYATNGDLVAVTQPGLGSSDIQTTRFYYTDVTIGSGLFDSGISVSGPSSVHTLQYVYLPASSDGSNPHVGYKFEYSPYGMVRQISEYRGMTVSSSSTSSAGSVTADGTLGARTTYDYPTSGDGRTDVPTYSTRTDDWAGRTTSGSAPQYTFSNNESTGVSTVTAPDGTISETHSIVDSGQWDDGLVSDTYVKDGSTTYAQTHMDWELDSNSHNPRVYQALSTDTPAGLTKATVLSYTNYNNISTVSERDFTTNGTVSSTELRRTETTYVTSSNYTNRHLLHLPSMVKVFPGGSSTAAARVDYTYDDYGTSHANMTARNDIIMHDPAFDPYQEDQESCLWVCYHWGEEICDDLRYDCSYYNPYVSSTDYRGNVTSVTSYADAASGSGSITHSTTYDIAGNVMTAQVDCCQTKSFTYSGSGTTGDYAHVLSVTSGNPSGTHLTSSATYDYNTGLVGTTTDENSQVTTNYYNSDSLRLDHVAYPDSGATYLTYSDGLSADGAGSYHFYVESATKLDNNGSGSSTRYVTSRQYFDGRGAVARTMSNQTSADGWSTQDVEYDTMGRAYQASNPYYASSYSATPASTRFWTTGAFDHLGRVYQVTMPTGEDSTSSNTTVTTSYDGVYTTVTDQASKVRRQKVDALGRVIRLDEPTTSGLGSTSSPNQATSYDYDVLGNPVHIAHGSQDRYFKYDSLSRLTRERQVEQDTNSSYNLSDSLTGNSSWSRKVDYNSSGLVTDGYDARGVHSTFTYDDLNRVTQISYSDSTPTAYYYYDSQSLPSGAPSYTHSNTAGRLLAMTYGSSSSTTTGNYLAYDAMGRVVTQKQVTGSTTYGLSYTYNYAGLLTGETYPTSRAVGYSYDEGGRLSSVGDGTTTFASSFAYVAHGGLSSETFGNTAVHAMSYNRRLQASQAKFTLGATVLQQYDYGYGQFNTSTGAVDTSKNNGQIGNITGTISGTTQWLQGFQYDELGRLSNVAEYQSANMSSQTYSQGYSYDRYGNRAQSANSTLGLPAVSSSDYSSSTNRFGSGLATYDNAGNITTDSKFRSMTYAYDANGRQTSASNGSFTETQTYDCAGQRVQTSAYSVTRTMVYDVFGQMVADYSGSTLESENIYRGGQLLARYNAGTSSWTYVMTDAQGSARAVMNNSGGSSSVIARHDYLPFGEEIASGIGLRTTGQGFAATDTNRQKYAMTERDDVTGLDHTWWRKYESFSGRWTSPDPINGHLSNPQSFNHYTYSGNDPVNFVDPTGLDQCFARFEVTTTIHSDGRVEVSWEYLNSYCLPTDDDFPIAEFAGGGGPGGGGPGGGVNQRPGKERPLIIEKPKQPRDPGWKSQAEKQKDFTNCVNRELKDLNIELHQLMNENLDLMVGGDILALPISLNGLQAYNLLSLGLWQLQLMSFNKRFEPARQAAMKTCRKEAGLD